MNAESRIWFDAYELGHAKGRGDRESSLPFNSSGGPFVFPWTDHAGYVTGYGEGWYEVATRQAEQMLTGQEA